jgi:ribonuclease Z
LCCPGDGHTRCNAGTGRERFQGRLAWYRLAATAAEPIRTQTLVGVRDQKLLFDAGRGVPIRLRQINVQLAKITALFITHYLSATHLEYRTRGLTGWLPAPYARRTTPVHIGPVGAKTLMANLEKAYALDIKIRLEDEKLPPEVVAVVVEEFEQDGVVYEKDGVKVIAFTVDHGPATSSPPSAIARIRGPPGGDLRRHPL